MPRRAPCAPCTQLHHSTTAQWALLPEPISSSPMCLGSCSSLPSSCCLAARCSYDTAPDSFYPFCAAAKVCSMSMHHAPSMQPTYGCACVRARRRTMCDASCAMQWSMCRRSGRSGGRVWMSLRLHGVWLPLMLLEVHDRVVYLFTCRLAAACRVRVL